MNRLFYILLLLCLPLFVKAQMTSGTKGLLKIPTAEMYEDGSFVFGGNYLPEEITPERFYYNTGNYFLNLTFLPFIDVTYRCTLIKNRKSGKYTEQDRTFGVRLQLFKEKKVMPAIVFGADDVYSDESDGGVQSLGAMYGVATKNIYWNDCRFGLTVGSGFKAYNGNQLDGPFGGISFSPAFARNLSLIAEYDSDSFNAGATLLLWNHLYLQGFMYDMKNFVGGVAYRVVLGGRRRK